MNGTANALQVAAVLFLFGNTIISPAAKVKEVTVNKSTAEKVKQNDEQNKLSTYNVMGSYINEVTDERLNQPLYLHPAISAEAINTVTSVHTAFPLAIKKTGTVQMVKK